jgi:hypothetical protein
MDARIHSISWLRRAPGQAPVLVRNGLEELYSGSVADLICLTKAVTLIARDGAEVQVAVRRMLGPETWEAEILRFAPTSFGLKVGATVSFEASHVQGGTI